MRLYTTKHPRERFNIRWNRRKSAFRLAARGLALYIYPGPLIEWSLVILVTLTAFRLGVIYAYLERGYQARGGEYLLLLIPPIYYAAKRTLLDWIADLRRAKGRRERSAVSTPFKECPSCGAHLDAGERCDCKETAAADRAQANTARITPPARAYYVGVDLADGKDYTATARGLVENG